MVSYSSVEKSDVIVDFYSTLSIEAWVGVKILLCDLQIVMITMTTIQ